VKDQHWRTTRALTEVALMVNSVDHARALVIARAIAAENKRATAIRRLENAEASEPRAFFWGNSLLRRLVAARHAWGFKNADSRERVPFTTISKLF
jgi:hypothetical protein